MRFQKREISKVEEVLLRSLSDEDIERFVERLIDFRENGFKLHPWTTKTSIMLEKKIIEEDENFAIRIQSEKDSYINNIEKIIEDAKNSEDVPRKFPKEIIEKLEQIILKNKEQ